MRKSNLIHLSLLVLFASLLPAQEVWTPEKMMREMNPGNPVVSPDGKWVAFILTEALMCEEKSEYLTHIWLASADGSETFQLTRGDKTCRAPEWSPDGKWLAFLSTRSGKNNIWLIRPDGGEAVRLTDVDPGVGDYDWSPGGEEIAFLMNDAETEEEKQEKKSKDDARFVGENPKCTHLYRVPAKLPEGDFPEPKRVTEGGFHITGFDWSPDGDVFVVTHQETPDINDWRSSDISTVPVGGGELIPLVRGDGYDSSAVFSPKGEAVAFISDLGNMAWARRWRICVQSLDGGERLVLPETFDSRPGLWGWASDGTGVYYTEPYQVSRKVFFIPTDGSEAHQVIELPGIVSSIDVSADNTLLAFSYEDLEEPEEIYIAALADGRIGEPTILTETNAHMLDLPLAKSEVITWESFDSSRIEGILHYPLGYQEGKSYPLLLNVHGGPAGVYSRSFTAGSSIYPLQAFQAEGFFVLQANPRGSSGYGWEFRFANISDWGGGDYRDLMAGVDLLIERGVVDPEKLGVMGWSYGGYMTSWVITQTDRFRAAAVGAGVTNLVSFTGTTDILGFLPSYFEGEMWERAEVFRARSAMHNIADAVTPTLVIHGENDVRVPISQGYELYHALKRKGIETRMLVLPRTPHGPREPKLLMAVGRWHLDWFCEKLLGEN